MQQEKVRLMSVITCGFLGNAQIVSIRGPKIKQLSSIFHFYIVSRPDASVQECSAWATYLKGNSAYFYLL